MSIESFEAFVTRLASDDTLREALRAQAPDGMDAAQLAAAAARHGFSFSAEEISATTDAELDEQALDGVVGGTFHPKLLTSSIDDDLRLFGNGPGKAIFKF